VPRSGTQSLHPRSSGVRAILGVEHVSRQLVGVEAPPQRRPAHAARGRLSRRRAAHGQREGPPVTELQRSAGNSAVAELMIQRACMLEPHSAGGPAKAVGPSPRAGAGAAAGACLGRPDPGGLAAAGHDDGTRATAPAPRGRRRAMRPSDQGSKGSARASKARRGQGRPEQAQPLRGEPDARRRRQSFGPSYQGGPRIKLQGDKKLWKDGRSSARKNVGRAGRRRGRATTTDRGGGPLQGFAINVGRSRQPRGRRKSRVAKADPGRGVAQPQPHEPESSSTGRSSSCT